MQTVELIIEYAIGSKWRRKIGMRGILIRCKNCRFWIQSDLGPHDICCRKPRYPMTVNEYDFCSWARRKREKRNGQNKKRNVGT